MKKSFVHIIFITVFLFLLCSFDMAMGMTINEGEVEIVFGSFLAGVGLLLVGLGFRAMSNRGFPGLKSLAFVLLVLSAGIGLLYPVAASEITRDGFFTGFTWGCAISKNIYIVSLIHVGIPILLLTWVIHKIRNTNGPVVSWLTLSTWIACTIWIAHIAVYGTFLFGPRIRHKPTFENYYWHVAQTIIFWGSILVVPIYGVKAKWRGRGRPLLRIALIVSAIAAWEIVSLLSFIN